MIPLFKVRMSPQAPKEVGKVLMSGYVGQGPKYDELESKLATELGKKPILTNSCTSALSLALRLAGVSPGDKVISTPQTCLWGGSSVVLENGDVVTIRSLVESKYSGKVMSRNAETGVFEPKEVINWYTSDLGDRTWINISHIHAMSGKPIKTNKTKGTWVTNDHPVLTPEGYRKAETLKNGDLVATCFKSPNRLQKSIIVGTMLGDASLRSGEGNGKARLSFTHTKVHSEYVYLKRKALGDIVTNTINCPAKVDRVKATKESLCCLSNYNPALGEIYDKFYPDGKKSIPSYEYLMEHLDARALSCWYMDDGSKHPDQTSIICTDCFSEEDHYTLKKVIQDKFGITAHIRVSLKGDKVIRRLYFNRQEHLKLSKIIAKFVPECLRYKLSDSEALEEFNLRSWDVGTNETYFAKVLVKKGSNPKGRYGISTTYCIDVKDNHNFISGEIVLHNCLATNSVIALESRANILWADIDPRTGNIDPQSVNNLIAENPDVKAIVAVNWAGRLCDYKSLKSHGIPVIEDAAHNMVNRPWGESSGDYICYSLQAIKFWTSGDGGILFTPEDKFDLGYRLNWYGLDRRTGASFRCSQDVQELGYKYHMNDIAATIALANYDLAMESVKEHKNNALRIWNEIKDLNTVSIPKWEQDCDYWLMSILVEKGTKEKFIEHAGSRGIACNPIHRRNDTFSCLSQFRRDRLHGVDEFSRKQVSIPVGWWLSDNDLEDVINMVKSYEG